jgi:hypothetical protein
MPRRTVLTPSQRERFERLPSKPEELVCHCSLSREDLALIVQRREGRNKLGFALVLCLLRYLGRALRSDEVIPQELINFIAEQIDISPEDFSHYAKRDETRRSHLAFLTEKLGFHAFSRETHFQELVNWLTPVAFENPEGVFLVGALLNELRRRCILNPGLGEIERVAAAAQLRAQRRAFKVVCERLDQAARQALDAWLEVEPGQEQSRLSWARQPAGAPSPNSIIQLLERLKAIEELKLPTHILQTLPSSRRQALAREGLRVSISHLRAYPPERRLATTAICLLETSRALADEAIAAHDRVMAKILRRSRRKQANLLQEQGARIKQAMRFFSRLGQALVTAREQGREAWEAIDETASWETVCQAVAEVSELAESKSFDPLAHVAASHQQARRYAPEFLERLAFEAEPASADALRAVDIGVSGRFGEKYTLFFRSAFSETTFIGFPILAPCRRGQGRLAQRAPTRPRAFGSLSRRGQLDFASLFLRIPLLGGFFPQRCFQIIPQ